MNLKPQAYKGCSTGPAPALANSTTNSHHDWLGDAATRFCAAITLQAPVGFEDEEGFHCGVPPLSEITPTATLTR